MLHILLQSCVHPQRKSMSTRWVIFYYFYYSHLFRHNKYSSHDRRIFFLISYTFKFAISFRCLANVIRLYLFDWIIIQIIDFAFVVFVFNSAVEVFLWHGSFIYACLIAINEPRVDKWTPLDNGMPLSRAFWYANGKWQSIDKHQQLGINIF